MPRIRSVHPGICDDEVLARCSASAERTFVRLWTQLDDDGRHEDRPKLLAARLYPEHDDMGPEEVDRDLNELAHHGLLIRYEHGGRRFLSAKPEAWSDHQKPKHYRESDLPAPPPGDGRGTAGGHVSDMRPHGVVVGDGVGEGGVSAEPDGPAAADSSPLERREDVDTLCDLLAELIEGNDCKRPAITGKWRTEARRLLDRDGRDRDEAERVMRWALEHPFWRSNILSMPKFREKYDQLRLQMRNDGRPAAVGATRWDH